MYKYVFFDLDGTITEPEEGIINGVLYALSKFEITVEDRTTLYPYIGPPLRDSFREFHDLSEKEAEQLFVLLQKVADNISQNCK